MTTATATRTRKPRSKPIRNMTVLGRLDSGALLIEVSEKSGPNAATTFTTYYVTAIAADFGNGFLWEKFEIHGGEKYHVNTGDATHPASCECLGHLKHGHKTTCKHIAGSRKLIEKGKL